MANVYKNKLVEIYGLPDSGKTKFVWLMFIGHRGMLYKQKFELFKNV